MPDDSDQKKRMDELMDRLDAHKASQRKSREVRDVHVPTGRTNAPFIANSQEWTMGNAENLVPTVFTINEALPTAPGPMSLIPEEPVFHGATFGQDLDFDRLKNNTIRVFALLLDGKWHLPSEFQAIGGSRWSGRVRSLREAQFGSLTIDAERHRGGIWRYRLDLTSLNEALARKILKGGILANRGKTR